MIRKRFANGLIIGFRRGEWWVGARHNFVGDAWELGLFGLTLIIPLETVWRWRRKP